ncbi:MAG: hypothetical protein AAB373_00570 [Patescibacteria group bacterium]
MHYKQIISDSWKYTQENKKLIIWFGFIPSIFTTTFGVGYMTYQFFAFKNSYLFGSEKHGVLGELLGYIWNFVKTHTSLSIPLIIMLVIFMVIYLLLPTLCRAAAIQTIARNKNGQNVGVGAGLKYGFMPFLKLFEYHLLIKTFGFFSILFEMGFVMRNLGLTIFELLLPVFILFIVIGFILTLLFTYADFYIVVDDENVFESMKKSAKLVMTHWKHTFLVTVLMMLIGVRIIFQVFLVFLIPSLIIGITGYLATVTLPVTGVIVGGSVGLIALLIASYLNGIVDVFSYTVWTHTFLDLSTQKELSAREAAVVNE